MWGVEKCGGSKEGCGVRRSVGEDEERGKGGSAEKCGEVVRGK